MTKKCSRCKEMLLFADFSIDRRQPTGLRPDCKVCRSKRNKELYNTSEQTRNRNKNNSLLKTYNIDLESYQQMLAKQKHKCAICKQESKEVDKKYNRIRALVVDHCHKTGKIRGLLCGPCNRALGGFTERMESLLGAIAYLDIHDCI